MSRTLREAIGDLIERVDLVENQELIDEINNLMPEPDDESRSWKDEYQTMKDKYDALYKEYQNRFMETFREPKVNEREFDVKNEDTTFTEKDLYNFDFSGINE